MVFHYQVLSPLSQSVWQKLGGSLKPMKPCSGLPTDLECNLTPYGLQGLTLFCHSLSSISFLWLSDTFQNSFPCMDLHTLVPLPRGCLSLQSFELTMSLLPFDHSLNGSFSERLFLTTLCKVFHSLLFCYPRFVHSFINSTDIY